MFLFLRVEFLGFSSKCGAKSIDLDKNGRVSVQMWGKKYRFGQKHMVLTIIIYLSFASSTFEGQGARSRGQEECYVRLFAIWVCMSKVSSCSLPLAPCSLTQLAKVELVNFLFLQIWGRNDDSFGVFYWENR